MRFRAIIQLNGKSATGIQVPEDVLSALGAGKRPPISVTINGYTYRTSVGSMGGVPMIPVSAEVRQRAGVAAGAELDVDIELDTQPREVSVPEDFADALAAAPDAKRFFENLSYSEKRRLVTPIEDAKTPDTRIRRISTTITKLQEGKI